MEHLIKVWLALQSRHRDEQGFVTAEHLGVAALAIAALVVIFGVMQALGISVVNEIGSRLGITPTAGA